MDYQQVIRTRLPNTMDCDTQFVRFDVVRFLFKMATWLTPSVGFISTASGRARLGQSGFLTSSLGSFFRRLYLAGTFIHSSSLPEALGLFISGFFAAVSCGLTVSSLSRFRNSGVLLTTICGAVWQPSSLMLLKLWVRASFTSLPRAFSS